jgi:DNA-directed RNA polymerase subunit beta'
MYTTKGRKFQRLEIGLASPKQIREWAERYLPNGEIVGEVTSWETVNYKTLKPELNGLFCQRIFGPVIDYTCACGKKSNKVQIGFCQKCGVERTTSRVRRYRLGYIRLKQPVVHTLYAAHKPSPLSLCLDWSNKRIQAVMCGTEFCHLSTNFRVFSSKLQILHDSSEQQVAEKPNVPFLNHGVSSNENLMGSEIHRTPRKKNTEHSFITTELNCFGQKINQKKPRLFRTNSVRLQKNIVSAKNENFSNSARTYLVGEKLLRIQNNCISTETESNKITTIQKLYPFRKLELGLHLYGVSYDMTWRQVEDLQEFLLYSWEQPLTSDFFIPYYSFLKIIKNKTSQDSPIHNQHYPIQTGGFVFQKILAHFDLVPFQKQLRLQHQELKNSILFLQEKLDLPSTWEKERLAILKKLNRLKQSEKKCLRRLHYFRDFHNTQMQPAWMMLSYLPVLPPGLRPITSIRGELVVSDINSLYRKILTRNKRISSSTQFGIFDTALSGSWASWCYNLRQVQEAVDNLLKTGSVESGKTTKSLLDSLKGKKGRFRQHLLGKRVDYSGRSVIVVGPNLKVHECGLPKQMAIELFQPFIIQKLRNKGIAFTTTAAKAIIAERKPVIWNILSEIMKNHPVLLNRAPTLHRLGIQAFLPKLVEGKAILLHPLVCPAFNADFDGDQMAVHVPLSPAARAEALNLLWARNHLLAPSSGQPLLLPTQDMVLGCYYLTIAKEINVKYSVLKEKTNSPGFSANLRLDSKANLMPLMSTTKKDSQNEFVDMQGPKKQVRLLPSGELDFGYKLYYFCFAEVQEAYDRGLIQTHSPIWVKWLGNVQNLVPEQQAKNKEIPLELRIDIFGNSELFFADRYKLLKFQNINNSLYIRTTPGRVLLHMYLSGAHSELNIQKISHPNLPTSD